MKSSERAKLLDRYRDLPCLTDAEARIAAQPRTDAEEQFITQRLWNVAAALKEANYRLPPQQPVEYTPRVFTPVEPERERDL
jgi:hypothetical protein